MALAYTKEFLIEVYVSRFLPLGESVVEKMRKLGRDHYDRVGKDEFRKHASVDADAIKLYKAKHATN